MLMPIIAAVGSFVVSERILKPKITALALLLCLAIFDVFISPPYRSVVNDDDPTASVAGNGTHHASHHHKSHHLDEFGDDPLGDGSEEGYDAEMMANFAAPIYPFSNGDYGFGGDDLSQSMRCYRGPSLLAVALFCSAYCLRVWRRNGVACDELLFLPDTPHEYRCIAGGEGGESSGGGARKLPEERGVIGTTIQRDSLQPLTLDRSTLFRTRDNIDDDNDDNNATIELRPLVGTCFSEGDAAAGVSRPGTAPNNMDDEGIQRQRSNSDGGSMALTPRCSNAWGGGVGEGGSEGDIGDFDNGFTDEEIAWIDPIDPSSPTSVGDDASVRSVASLRERAHSIMEAGFDMLIVTERWGSQSDGGPNSPVATAGATDAPGINATTSEVYDAEYAPSGPSVLGAALDLSLPVLFNFHMFVVLMKEHYAKEAQGNDDADVSTGDDGGSGRAVTEKVVSLSNILQPPDVPPDVLPLIFFSVLIIRSQIPPRSRWRFFGTVFHATARSPFRRVRFRDAFVGDCATSFVRPIADLVFALVYIGAVVFGFVTGRFSLSEARGIVSRSGALHGVVLPLCAVLPLWWRFLQTIRQAYDAGKRWPYLGDAFKYLWAGMVVLYGMTHAAGSRDKLWKISFAAATVYQIVWDVVVDWELLVIVPRSALSSPSLLSEAQGVRNASVPTRPSSTAAILIPRWMIAPCCCLVSLVSRIFLLCRFPRWLSIVSSLSPRLFPSRFQGAVVLPLRRRIVQPIARVWRRIREAVPRPDQIRLRPRRLFDDDAFYWRALVGNAALRFCWMTGFIPAYRVSFFDGTTQETLARSWTQSWTFVALSVLEIFRRCVWSIIKVELETLKMTTGGVGGSDSDPSKAPPTSEYQRESMSEAHQDGDRDRDDGEVEHVRKGSDDYKEISLLEQVESTSIFVVSGELPIKPKKTRRWCGISFSTAFLQRAFLVELALWPVVFVVLGYYCVSAE